MFYYSIASKEKVVHYEGCCCLNNIKADNLKSFKSIKDVRQSGYRLCSCCSPIMGFLKKEGITIENYCRENGLSYFVHNGDLHVATHCSNWKVLPSDNRKILELHHKNCFEREDEKSVPGYHRQRFFSDSILGHLEYIIEHENYRMLNPLYVAPVIEPPKKGTKNYKKHQKLLAKKERKRKIGHVLHLIEQLSRGHCVASV